MRIFKQSILCLVLCTAVLFLSGFGTGTKPTDPTEVPLETQEPADPMVISTAQIYSEFTGESGIILHCYNDQGQLVEKRQDAFSQVTQYTYHENGICASEVIYQQDQLYMAAEYDELGNPVKRGYLGEGEEIDYRETWTNEYDDQNRLVRQEYRDQGLGYDAVFTYHEDGSFDIEYTDVQETEKGSISTTKKTGQFRQDGTQLSVKNESLDPDDTSTGLWTHEYDEHGNPLKTTYEHTDKQNLSRYVTEYRNRYSADGILVATEVYESEYQKTGNSVKQNTPLTYRYKIDYTYDGEGHLVYELTTMEDTGSGLQQAESAWQYDEEGNLIYFKGVKFKPDVERFLSSPTIGSVYMEETYQYLPLSQLPEAQRK